MAGFEPITEAGDPKSIHYHLPIVLKGLESEIHN
jgi:hypothetical protein